MNLDDFISELANIVVKVKSYSGYHGCDKCIQTGQWNGKMTFPEVNAALRTDQSFSQMLDEENHLGLSFSWVWSPSFLLTICISFV